MNVPSGKMWSVALVAVTLATSAKMLGTQDPVQVLVAAAGHIGLALAITLLCWAIVFFSWAPRGTPEPRVGKAQLVGWFAMWWCALAVLAWTV